MINVLGIDPTRSIMLRRRFSSAMTSRFNKLKAKVTQLLVVEDALNVRISKDPFQAVSGQQPLVNVGWEFLDTPGKIEEFKKWLRLQISLEILEKHTTQTSVDSWLQTYIAEGFKKGVGRSFDDVRKPWSKLDKGDSDYLAGTKDEFMRSAFSHPVSVDRVKVLAARSYTELEGITDAMSADLTKELTDGLIQGLSPRQIARAINKRIDKVNNNYALSMARTDIVRAHAEGQLYSLERLGLTHVGVAVEWSTSGHNVCPQCSSMQGVVLKLSEAHGMLPRHKNCRCAYIPANVGEETTGQLRSKSRILAAIEASLRAEAPSRSKAEQRSRSQWGGATKRIGKKRPKSIF